MSVDAKLKDTTVNWLANQNPPPTFKCLDYDDPNISTETDKSYAVILIDVETISPQFYQRLLNERGDPQLADFQNPRASPYHQTLANIPIKQSRDTDDNHQGAELDQGEIDPGPTRLTSDFEDFYQDIPDDFAATISQLRQQQAELVTLTVESPRSLVEIEI